MHDSPLQLVYGENRLVLSLYATHVVCSPTKLDTGLSAQRVLFITNCFDFGRTFVSL